MSAPLSKADAQAVATIIWQVRRERRERLERERREREQAQQSGDPAAQGER